MPRRAHPAPCYLAPDDAPAKKKILTEALRLFVRDGLCETSIRDIARATGYTNPALFKHFASKERLALHLFEQCYLNLFQAIERAMSGQRWYAAKQHALIASYLEMLDADRDALLYVQDNLRHFWPMMPGRVKRSSIVGQVQALLAARARRRRGDQMRSRSTSWSWAGWACCSSSRAPGSSAASPARRGGTGAPRTVAHADDGGAAEPASELR